MILNLYGDDVRILVTNKSELNKLVELSVNQLLPEISRVNEHIATSLNADILCLCLINVYNSS
ncbi:hypothetical protein BD560DRAFT_414128 [Blakeslea trispora]|nr:hypothetical protein BD560DRAFT_414128 [Blakeslea trispora]